MQNKHPKVPKKHTQLNLPVGSRVRFIGTVASAMHKPPKGIRSVVLGNLKQGTIADGPALEVGYYWLRQLHAARAIKTHCQRIRYIDYIPGAPACPKPCPAPPPPLPRCASCGGKHKTKDCLGVVINKVIDSPLTGLAKIIAAGDVDEQLDSILQQVQIRLSQQGKQQRKYII